MGEQRWIAVDSLYEAGLPGGDGHGVDGEMEGDGWSPRIRFGGGGRARAMFVVYDCSRKGEACKDDSRGKVEEEQADTYERWPMQHLEHADAHDNQRPSL